MFEGITELFGDTKGIVKILMTIYIFLIIWFVGYNFLKDLGLKIYLKWYGVEGLANQTEEWVKCGIMKDGKANFAHENSTLDRRNATDATTCGALGGLWREVNCGIMKDGKPNFLRENSTLARRNASDTTSCEALGAVWSGITAAPAAPAVTETAIITSTPESGFCTFTNNDGPQCQPLNQQYTSTWCTGAKGQVVASCPQPAAAAPTAKAITQTGGEDPICSHVNWEASDISSMCNTKGRDVGREGPYADKTLAEVCPTGCAKYAKQQAAKISVAAKVAAETGQQLPVLDKLTQPTTQPVAQTASQPTTQIQPTSELLIDTEVGVPSQSVAATAASSAAEPSSFQISDIGGLYPQPTDLSNIQGGPDSTTSMTGVSTETSPVSVIDGDPDVFTKIGKITWDLTQERMGLSPTKLTDYEYETLGRITYKLKSEELRKVLGQKGADVSPNNMEHLLEHVRIKVHNMLQTHAQRAQTPYTYGNLRQQYVSNVPRYTYPSQYTSGQTNNMYGNIPTQSLGTTYDNRLGGNYPSYRYNVANSTGTAYTNQYHPVSPAKKPTPYNSLMDFFR